MKPTSKNDTQRAHLLKGGAITLVSPAELNVGENEEMHLIYGGHSNKTLFVEYGFVVQFSAEAICNGQFCGEVDVQDLVEKLFQEREESGEWMRDILVMEGYWGYISFRSSLCLVHTTLTETGQCKVSQRLPIRRSVSSQPCDSTTLLRQR